MIGALSLRLASHPEASATFPEAEAVRPRAPQRFPQRLPRFFTNLSRAGLDEANIGDWGIFIVL